ncbi:MAG TPA: dienelactone hydrolase family protein [Methylomirabilota bacterium]|jgi:carboxymethylenebutenolidase|nr:dienelactone hydrolase family protein [Methylomirabilota bacterium]
MEIKTERVHISVEGKTMGGYLARPTDGAPRPGVLVFMEIFGINSHIREVTERVAREGYVALAPDYFHRTAPGVEYGYDQTGFTEGLKLLNALKADEVVADARAALSFLKRQNYVRSDKLGAMGFCIGGHVTYLTACETDVKAAASFYGGGIAKEQGLGGQASTVGRTSKIQGKILCLFGEKDPLIPMSDIEKIRAELQKHQIRHEIVVYPGADHGFFCDQRGSYDKKSADDAWERVKKLFAEELGA